MVSKVKLFKQVIPVLIGSMLGVSFGTMFGWPSTAYPRLVNPETAPIFITWDQTALLAGFLMSANIIGTAFCGLTLLGSKAGVLLSFLFQIAGWLVLFMAQDATGIGISRALVGFGNGFGAQQLRTYAQNSCESNVFQLLMQYMPLALNFEVILVYVIGSFVEFRELSLVCAGLPLFALLLFALTPNNCCAEESLKDVETIYKVQSTKNSELGWLSFIKALKVKNIRNNFILLTFLIFIPQYMGGASNIVYSEIIYSEALNPFPKVCAVVYAFVFLFSTVVALKYTKKYSRKLVVLGSCIICALTLSLICFYFYFLVELLSISKLLAWSPLFLLSLFNFFNTAGANIVPVLLIGDKFPENLRNVIAKFYVIHFSVSGLISTKIFQVMFTYFGMHMAFAFLASIGLRSALIISCFVRETSHGKCLKRDGFYNEAYLGEDISSVNANISQNQQGNGGDTQDAIVIYRL